MSDVKDTFEQLIQRLPDKQNRTFELTITDYIIDQKDENIVELKQFLHNMVQSGSYYFHRYIAFISLATLYRRLEEVSYLNILFDDYQEAFKDEPLFLHYRALKHTSNGNLARSIADSLKALRNPELADHSGILHSYAECVITLIENNEQVSFDDMNQLEERAFRDLERAIEENQHYAKFYATKARFFAHRQQFKDAKHALRTAIDLEKKGNDYQLRIARYYQLLSNVQVQEELADQKTEQHDYIAKVEAKLNAANETIDHKLAEQEAANQKSHERIQEMIDGMRQQNLQMLGFFTAIISFTVGSIQIIKGQSFTAAVLLLLVLGGILLVAYAGFSFLMFTNDKAGHSGKTMIVISLGIGLIVCSLITYQQGWL
ncbi:hypothetical protein GCM10008983_08020 [Lentibacillus halophilus]|uniref:Tetratricopeptide repeat-containing protein n=1 Tax=Lentibacillus halophilus TaxID=295065 RepID=A0ABN0Z509_9BACI